MASWRKVRTVHWGDLENVNQSTSKRPPNCHLNLSSWGIIFLGQVRGKYQRAVLIKEPAQECHWALNKVIAKELSAKELYTKQRKRHGPLQGLFVSPNTMSETFISQEYKLRSYPTFLLTSGICQHRMLCFGNKEPPNSSSLNQQTFLSFSHECPPAGGFALHHPHSRPRRMKHPLSGTCWLPWQTEREALESQAAATKCSPSKVTRVISVHDTHFPKRVSGPA